MRFVRGDERRKGVTSERLPLPLQAGGAVGAPFEALLVG